MSEGRELPQSMRHAYQHIGVDRARIRASHAHFRHAGARVFRPTRWRTDCSPPRLAKEHDMNWEQVEGNWHQFKGQIRSKWGKLTDDDLKVLSGKREMLIGKIQERYGIRKEEAERQVEEWASKLEHGQQRGPGGGTPRQ
jgi:uncharacterized protein YjbJ (UPF0337 family)